MYNQYKIRSTAYYPIHTSCPYKLHKDHTINSDTYTLPEVTTLH